MRVPSTRRQCCVDLLTALLTETCGYRSGSKSVATCAQMYRCCFWSLIGPLKPLWHSELQTLEATSEREMMCCDQKKQKPKKHKKRVRLSAARRERTPDTCRHIRVRSTNSGDFASSRGVCVPRRSRSHVFGRSKHAGETTGLDRVRKAKHINQLNPEGFADQST